MIGQDQKESLVGTVDVTGTWFRMVPVEFLVLLSSGHVVAHLLLAFWCPGTRSFPVACDSFPPSPFVTKL